MIYKNKKYENKTHPFPLPSPLPLTKIGVISLLGNALCKVQVLGGVELEHVILLGHGGDTGARTHSLGMDKGKRECEY